MCVVVVVQLMFVYYAVNKTFCRRTSVRPQKMSDIRYNANRWGESRWGISFCGIANELLLRIVCRTGRLKPFSNCMRTVIYFRSDRVSLLFMGEIRVKARFSYGCTIAKAAYIQWSKILTVCNIARVHARYALWLQLFCGTVILSHSDLQLSA